MFRPITVVCDGCNSHFNGMNNGHTREDGYHREDIETALKTDGWKVVESAGPFPGGAVGKHLCPNCAGPRVIVSALGPDERGVHWFDATGVEWRSIGHAGQRYEGYGSLWQHSAEGRWQYGDPVAELAPYREA